MGEGTMVYTVPSWSLYGPVSCAVVTNAINIRSMRKAPSNSGSNSKPASTPA